MTVSESRRTGNLEQFVKEMDLAHIELSVVPGRKNLGWTARDVSADIRDIPGVLWSFPILIRRTEMKALYEIDRCPGPVDIRGVSIEPTLPAEALRV